MTPTPAVLENLKHLAVNVLEPLREALGRPIFITSGYRTFAVNAGINGATRSAHLYGLAADVTVPGLSTWEAAWIMRQVAHGLPIAKLIVEFGRWVHVQAERPGIEPRRDMLIAEHKDGSTVYSVWA